MSDELEDYKQRFNLDNPFLKHFDIRIEEMRPGFAPVTHEDMVAEARVIKKGRQIVLGEADVKSPEGRHFARALATYMIIPSTRA